MSNVPHGEPYAGKLHVRFDEGADVPCGGVSLYSTPQCIGFCHWSVGSLASAMGLWHNRGL